MAISYRLTDSAKEYFARIPEVAQLFSNVFRRAFPDDIWRQWYLDNPYGEPYVCLGYHDDELVAHHALVPQVLEANDGQRLPYLLSKSTMIHPGHRGLREFLHSADALHEVAKAASYTFILAFPNSSSAPVFEKACGYSPILQTQLCNWKLSPLAAGPSERMAHPSERVRSLQYSYPTDSVYWCWRTRHNQAECRTLGGGQIVYKVILPATLMILDVHTADGPAAAQHVTHLAEDLGLKTIRLTRCHADQFGVPAAELVPHEDYVVRFFGFSLCANVPDVRFSLLLSDVF